MVSDMPSPSDTTRRVRGPFIRALREALGMRHGNLAVAAGISAGYLSHIEREGVQPSPAVTYQIAQALGVSIDSITYPTTCEHADEIAS